MVDNFRRVKFGCYMTNISMAIVSNMSPLLFLTFNENYNIAYSLLGTLVLINFVTQLSIDLIFSLFSHKFNIPKTIKIMPYISVLGLIIYAVYPFIFPNNVYLGLTLGTVIFSFSSGLAEVLISPTIAAIPSKDPDREMSKLHSVYAWGTVGFVITFTLLLLIFGSQNWQWISLLFCIVPIIAGLSFSGINIPQIHAPEKISGTFEIFKNNGIWLLFFAIFFGGASEVTMAQWSSSYLELSLGLPKVWGDIFGVALFAIMLGLGRTLYSKFGKNICKVLVLGAIGATICYFVAAIVNISFIGLLACGLTGFCTSMMWPGSLIAAADRYPNAGVFIYALMAAGGDLGASLGPQAVGLVTDLTLRIPFALTLAENLSLTPEQLGMKLGLLVGMLFPLIGIFVYCKIMKWYKKVN